VVGGTLELDGELRGYTGVGGTSGTLEIQTAGITIKTLEGGAVAETDTTTGALLLSPEFFSTGGFGKFVCTGLGTAIDNDGDWVGGRVAFAVTEDTLVSPKVKNWLTIPGVDAFNGFHAYANTRSVDLCRQGPAIGCQWYASGE